MNSDRSWCFVTGMGRSGTTLLAKLISQHPDAMVFSQPLPLLFVNAKREFLHAHGLQADPYPLSPYYACGYKPEQFSSWLSTVEFSPDFVRRALDDMSIYSGRYSSPAMHASREPLSFTTLLKHLIMSASCSKQATKVIGLKEVFCEEYLPNLLESGFRCVLVYRDPRDVAASLRTRSGPHHAGERRPLLFDVRNWRKSIEFMVRFQAFPNLLCVQYEDLVGRTKHVMSQIAAFLMLDSSGESVDEAPIRTADGAIWPGNSSRGQPFHGISRDPVGSFQDDLTAAEVAYIETLCYAEMRYLGYSATEHRSFQDMLDIIDAFEDNPPSPRSEFSSLYSSDATNVEFERGRLSAVLGRDAPAPEYFLFPEVRESLT